MNKFLNKKRNGFAGVYLIYLTLFMTMVLCITVSLCAIDNAKFIANQTAYFVTNKAAVNLYNKHAVTGTYERVDKVLGTTYIPSKDYYNIFNRVWDHSVVKKDTTYTVKIKWDRNQTLATGEFGKIYIQTPYGYHAIQPDLQYVVVEK